MDDPKPEGLRERKMRETRRALEGATVDLALEFGLEQVTVEQIAERADVSPRTFFNYFASKEDALLGQSAREQDDDLLAGFPDEPSGAGVYQDLKLFLTEQFSERVVADELLEKRLLALAASPQLAKRQLGQLHELLERLTTRVAHLLALEARRTSADAAVGPPAGTGVGPLAGRPAEPLADPPPELLAEAHMLLRLCGAALGFTFDAWRKKGRVGRAADGVAEAFALLERTAHSHLPTADPRT